MKVLFLDIDGVLNNSGTKERFEGFIGVSRKMLKRLQGWLRGNDVKIVLSSAWRTSPNHWNHLQELGLEWVGMTRELGGPRGEEVKFYLLEHPEITHYAILDDNSDMLPEQLPYFVQTDYRQGLSPHHLKRLDEIFNI